MNETVFRLSKEKYVIEFNPTTPAVIEVNPGAIIEVETMCCSRGNVDHKVSTAPEQFRAAFGNYSPGMPLTGPIAIKGAKTGDTLLIEILNIEVNEWGWVMASKGKGAIRDIVETAETRIIPTINGIGIFENKYKFELNPMIGCIGTTPKNVINAGWPGNHGGNMDCKDVRAGVSLLLPVFVDGANLALGDLHSAQGDGEVGCSGIETGGKVLLRTRLLRGLDFPLPMIVSDEKLSVVVTCPTLDEAAKSAVEKGTLLLSKLTGESIADIGMLISLTSDIRICQMVDPAMTCRLDIPLRFIEEELKIQIHSLFQQAEIIQHR